MTTDTATRHASNAPTSPLDAFWKREPLVAHLEAVVGHVIGCQENIYPGTAVIHVDGRWGAGKSHFVDDFVDHLTTNPACVPTLAEPIVVRYDAWREARISPEWWSIAAVMNRDVRHRRALPTRWLMSIAGLWHRVLRSPPVLIAVLLLVLAYLGMAAGVWKNLATVGAFVTTATTLVTTALLVGRALFWASPAIARLNVRFADNQLGLISSIICGLRRWSPWQRRTRAQVVADVLLAVGGVALVAYAVRAGGDWSALLAAVRGAPWASAWTVPLVAVAIALVLIALQVPGWSGDSQRRRHLEAYLQRMYTAGDAAAAPPGARSWKRAGLADADLRAWLPSLVCAVVGAGALLLGAFAGPPWMVPARVAGLALLALAGHSAWNWYARPYRRRRPLLLVVDDLDRCSVERTVAVLETIHTLLREPVPPRWRITDCRPAPFVVLVPADGAWLRTAFEKVYESFGKADAQPARGLGSDFLQKIFDHSVMVPELTTQCAEEYLDTWPAHADRTGRLRSASGLPGNPQLLRRVVDTIQMLEAVDGQLRPPNGVHDDARADLRVRAAILAVRFPDLAGQILGVPLPLNADKSPAEMFPDCSDWGRADVRAVVGLATVGEIAAGFGRI